MTVRPPAMAGRFYPAQPDELRSTVRDCLQSPRRARLAPKALILPHAAYCYSGPVAGAGFATLETVRGRIERVVLAGPDHRSRHQGLATSTADAFATPLGEVQVDRQACALLEAEGAAHRDDIGHNREHSLEVHLPFLQETLGHILLIPLLVGRASRSEVAHALDRVWGGPETLVIVSSDLSHYYDHDIAGRMDRATSTAIEQLDAGRIGPEQACGHLAVGGLVELAARRGLQSNTLELKSSADAGGPPERVVGYGAYAFIERGASGATA